MSGLLRLIGAAGVIGALGVFLRELFRNQPHLLRGTTDASGPARTKNASKPSEKSSGPSPEGKTQQELYEQAQRLEIPGRSKMNKRQLEHALAKARGGTE